MRNVSHVATVREQGANQFKRMARTAALFSQPALTTLDTVLIRTRGLASLALTAAYFVEGVRTACLGVWQHFGTSFGDGGSRVAGSWSTAMTCETADGRKQHHMIYLLMA